MELGKENRAQELQHLKQVSRIKHKILEAYLPPWATILGSVHRKLRYFDCFAGPGRYEAAGSEVLGSPAIAVKVGKAFLERVPDRNLEVILTEENKNQIQELQRHLEHLKPFPDGLNVSPLLANSNDVVPRFVSASLQPVPSFFMIDPYGHPLPIPIINQILRSARSEVLINLMWWRINMDMANPATMGMMDVLFGDTNWREQSFLRESGETRRKSFLEYFLSKLAARFTFVFTIKYDALEDRVRGDRVKYYLIHASNNEKATLLMKEVMYKLGDEEGTFEFSGSPQGMLISETPNESELATYLLREFSGQAIGFDDLRAKTYRLPFRGKQYRSVLQALRKDGIVQVRPVSSKTDRGLKEDDLVIFPERNVEQ